VVVVDPIAVAAEEHRTGLEVDTADSALEGVVRSLVEDLVDIVAADRRVLARINTGLHTTAKYSTAELCAVVGCTAYTVWVIA
jgi:hypothetical protein